MAVNVSPRQFRQKHFAECVEKTVHGCGIDPSELELEITETLLVDAEHGVEETLARLQHHGIKIALDDFGTGYSSLAYLKRFSVGTVKIDRAFINDLPDDEGSAAIAHAIIAMAHALGKRVVAEGVETAEQRAFLASAQCDHFQGYFLSKPSVADDVAAFMRRIQSPTRSGTAVLA
jgi:EAL domain-containing protein (putative c-di-GMP-specific phosphodiesterase class I)